MTQNWIVGLEYDYSTFQTKSYQLAGGAAPLVYTFDARPRDIQSVVARVSYKFGAPLICALLIKAISAARKPRFCRGFFVAGAARPGA